MPQHRFPVQVTTLPDCDDITRFDGTYFKKNLCTVSGTYEGVTELEAKFDKKVTTLPDFILPKTPTRSLNFKLSQE